MPSEVPDRRNCKGINLLRS